MLTPTDDPAVVERRKKWVAALRSGEYKQGRHALHPEPDTYCCLGVACEIYRQDTGDGIWDGDWEKVDEDDVDNFPIFISQTGSSAYGLPPSVAEYFDIERSPEVQLVEEVRQLAELNDEGATFEDIADIIELHAIGD